MTGTNAVALGIAIVAAEAEAATATPSSPRDSPEVCVHARDVHTHTLRCARSRGLYVRPCACTALLVLL